MKPDDALKLLIEAIHLAQSRGAYNIKESATILPAIETFTNNTNKTMNTENMQDTNPNAVPGSNTGVLEQPTPTQSAPTVDEGPESEAEATPVEAPVEEVAQ